MLCSYHVLCLTGLGVAGSDGESAPQLDDGVAEGVDDSSEESVTVPLVQVAQETAE